MGYYYDQFIGVYKEAFSESFCNHLINLFKFNLNQTQNRKQDSISPLLSKDLSLDLEKIDKDLSKKISNFIENKILPLYCYKYNLYYGLNNGLMLLGHKIQQTLPTEGFHGWHFEHGPSKEDSFRVLAYTLYLNDVKSGGETEFLNQSIRIPPKTGSLCIFPSSFTHIHRGNPPLSGKKYILTGWFYFNKNLINE